MKKSLILCLVVLLLVTVCSSCAKNEITPVLGDVTSVTVSSIGDINITYTYTDSNKISKFINWINSLEMNPTEYPTSLTGGYGGGGGFCIKFISSDETRTFAIDNTWEGTLIKEDTGSDSDSWFSISNDDVAKLRNLLNTNTPETRSGMDMDIII